MRYAATLVLALALAAGGAGLALAQTPYAPPRMADGHPDLEGVWTNASITTLERPDRYPSIFIKPEEVDALTRANPQNVRLRTDDNQKLSDGLATLDGKDLAQGRGYNAFWIDPGTRFGVVNGQARTAWISNPSTGKIPYSDAGKKLAAAAEKRLGYGGPEVRPLADRCLATGGRTGPPMVNGLYNNHYQIVEAPGYVVIYTEMIAHARVIPITDHHGSAGLRPLFGDSIAHWDGDTLVIETTSFNDYHSWQDHPAYLSQNAKVTERFTRIAKDGLLYQFTVEDPVFYSQPWSGEVSFWSDGARMFEYACHEGNYAMEGILRGARVQEKKGVKLEKANRE
jgi:hypothetical protein